MRSAVLIQYTRVMDRRQDGQTDGIGVAYTSYSLMLSSVKTEDILRIELTESLIFAHRSAAMISSWCVLTMVSLRWSVSAS